MLILITVTGHDLNDEYSNIIASTGMQLPVKCLVDAARFAADAAFVEGEEKRKLRHLVDEGMRSFEAEFSALANHKEAATGLSLEDTKAIENKICGALSDQDDGFEIVNASDSLESSGEDRSCRIV